MLVPSYFFFLLFFSIVYDAEGELLADENSLMMLHVLFRHGNRTPEIKELYPNDPYLNETYFPFGSGQLTNAGKRREFSIGNALRQKYDDFLGPYFYPDLVDPWSTNYNRTKASLSLTLAALFPPAQDEVWNPNLGWQPVPYNYMPVKDDYVLMGTEVPEYLPIYNKYDNSPAVQSRYKKFKHIFQNISDCTGLNVKSFFEVYMVYFGLSTEQEWGFVLPKCVQKLWPKIITDLAVKQYDIYMGTTELVRYATGYFYDKIIKDTQNRINQRNIAKKLFLYSSHENNLAQTLMGLNVFEPHIPTYGSYIVFEIHNITNNFAVKVLYQNYSQAEPRVMKLPACDELCPFEQFISLVQEYLPLN